MSEETPPLAEDHTTDPALKATNSGWWEWEKAQQAWNEQQAQIARLATPEEVAEHEKAQKAWDDLVNHPMVQSMRKAYQQAQEHKHGPFVFLLNHNHNALRGCTTCGATWAGLMAGSSANLVWHRVAEPGKEAKEQ